MATQTVAVLGKYPHIKVRYDSGIDPYFALVVREALAKIDSQPVGSQMLQEIDGGNLPVKFGYKVAIMKLAVDLTAANAGKATSSTAPCSHAGAVNPTQGSYSVVKWISSQYATPDGSRPPFIGLAHELVHCWHNLNGTSVYDKSINEKTTTGIAPHDTYAISENLIRGEHNIPLRVNYTGA